MKILIVHNRYQQPGGEDSVVEREHALLVRSGHHVITYYRSNDEICGCNGLEKVELAAGTVWSWKTERTFAEFLRQHRPDVVHVHNTFMMISPSVYAACAQAGIPVIQTLHNYRFICPAATLFREGRFCNECIHHSLWRGIAHGCYHESRPTTAVVAAMLKVNRLLGTWKQIHTFLTLTEYSRRQFVEAGFPAARMVVKPNFVDPDPGSTDSPGDYVLYLGRLSPEKGVLTLCEAWKSVPRDAPLRLVGDGPLRGRLEETVRAAGLSNVSFVGHRSHADVVDLIKGARFVIVPSEWPELFGLAIVEAFACGVPVISSDIPSLAEIVIDKHCGLIFRAGDRADLAEKAIFAWNHPDLIRTLGRNARAEYEQKYTAERNLQMLLDVYGRAIGSAPMLKHSHAA